MALYFAWQAWTAGTFHSRVPRDPPSPLSPESWDKVANLAPACAYPSANKSATMPSQRRLRVIVAIVAIVVCSLFYFSVSLYHPFALGADPSRLTN
ncbi:MAG: hypothetical protein Q9212_005897 [Teloschistes hypoglaucus]